MEERSSQADVVVIGAGIVGLHSAIQLAKRGFKVTLIDSVRDQKRSFKVGESLLIFSNMFLRNISELDDLIDTSFPKHGVWFTYGMEGTTSFEDKPEWSVQSSIPAAMRDAYVDGRMLKGMIDDAQIVRPEAEDRMQEIARAHPNVTFLDTARVKDVHLGRDGGIHELFWQCRATQRSGTVRASWVIDCSGRARFLAKRLGHAAEDVEFNDGFRNSAVWAQFSGIKDEMFGENWRYVFGDGAVTSRDLSTLHLWGDGYWIWVIRLNEERISIGVSYDQKRAPPGSNYKEKFWNVIRRYRLFDDMLREDNVLEFNVFKNCQHCTDTYVSSDRYGIAGDAASVIDAYYSQGVSLALVTSWHIANIVEKDLRDGHLDRDYIERVNRYTKQDWHMMRNIVKFKYTSAIMDPRFFLLSHLLDTVMFSGAGSARYKLCKWLVETGGVTADETPLHKALRESLSKRLFFSKNPFVSPETIRRLQHRWQEKLAERAQWRLAHGRKASSLRSIVRTPGGLLQFWKLPFLKADGFADISPRALNGLPKALSITGEEADPAVLHAAPLLMAWVFMNMYVYDGLSTSVLKALVALGLIDGEASAQASQTIQNAPQGMDASSSECSASPGT
jgi:2-polyprenyl-6-methoxyphenol hydroxylase-like FAD-dependent oxidoreductase